MTRYVTADDGSLEPRYVLYRLCECAACSGAGKVWNTKAAWKTRCEDCRGEGRTRQEVASARDAAGLGQALITCGGEGEWEGCPLGLLDRQGETGKKWLIRPWLPSARNVSDAGRVLANSKKEKTT